LLNIEVVLRRTVLAVLILFAVTAAATADAAGRRTFSLKSGDIISGAVIEEDETSYKVETDLGLLTIRKDDIRPYKAVVKLKSGDRVTGKVLNENAEGITIDTNVGELFIRREKIDRIDFIRAERKEFVRAGDVVEPERWYYGDERLIDIFLDPTGYVLEENIFYISGLSWGVSVSERFQVMSQWWGYFGGNLNLRPKYMFYRNGDIESESAASIGLHLHLRGEPNKYVYQDTTSETFIGGSIATETVKDWVQVGSIDSSVGEIRIESNRPWGEIFTAYTLSNFKSSGRGRVNYTIGASATYFPDVDVMPRAYVAVDSDIRQSLKIIGQLYYDEYLPDQYARSNDAEMDSPLNFDFGFIYAYNEHLRIGMHYQPLFAAIYLKF
jgi:hypothetical protein